MPLITLELAETIPPATRLAYADAVHRGLVEGLGMDDGDRFQVIHPLPADHVVADPHYLGGTRRDVVYVRVLMTHSDGPDRREDAFRAIADRLEAAGVRPDDVFVVFTENRVGDWYPGARGAKG